MKRSRSPSPTSPLPPPCSLTVHFNADNINIDLVSESDRSGTCLRELMESYWKDATARPGTSLLCSWLELHVPDWTTRRVKAVQPLRTRRDIINVYWHVPAVGECRGIGMIMACVKCDGEVSLHPATNVIINSELETYICEQSRAVLARPEYSEFVRKQRDWKRDVAQIARLLDNLTIEEAIAVLRNRGY